MAVYFSGCYAHKPTLPEGLFNEISIFQKPLEAKDENDILKSYIDLYGAYKNNLLLLQTLQKLNN